LKNLLKKAGYKEENGGFVKWKRFDLV
jgi:hypothetical protein